MCGLGPSAEKECSGRSDENRNLDAHWDSIFSRTRFRPPSPKPEIHLRLIKTAAFTVLNREVLYTVQSRSEYRKPARRGRPAWSNGWRRLHGGCR